MVRPANRLFSAETRIPGIRILHEIGQGSQSVVYLAERDGRKVAVKIPRQAAGGADADALLRYRREAATLVRARHPGLIEILDVGEVHGTPYLVMEFVEGEALSARLEQSGPLAEPDLRNLAVALAGALAAVHRLGLVHRDVKPQNVLMGALGGPRLIDFGFVAGALGDTAEGEMIGTFLYSSPEQTGLLRRPVDGRSDLYSLGALLYQCATGIPPFRSQDVGDLIRRHATERPRSVRELNPEISEILAAMIEKLLAKDPDDRYQSGSALIADFEGWEQLTGILESFGLEALGSSLGRNPGKDGGTHELPLFGRERELTLLRERLDQASRRQGSCTSVEGVPGSGKSRLVREILRGAEDRGMPVLGGKCIEGDPTPFAPLRFALDAFLQNPRNHEAVRRAAGDQSALLRRFSPMLEKVLDGEPEERVENAQEQFNDALAGLILNLATLSSGAVLFVDDIQWVDEASRQVLKKLVQQSPAASLMMIVSARADSGPDGGHTALPFVERVLAEAGVAPERRIRLSLLDSAAGTRLVEAFLPNARVDQGFADRITSRSHGSPFAITEYLRAILDAGVIWPSWGDWRVDESGLDGLDLPTDVIQLVVKRVGRLDHRTRGILQAAAVVGTVFHQPVLTGIDGLESDAVHSALAEALRNQLIERTDKDEYVFIHDRVREALLSELTDDAVHSLHGRIAMAMDSLERPGGEYAYALAQHYALGETSGNLHRVFETNFAAGRKAFENFADEEAYAFLICADQAGHAAGTPTQGELDQCLGEVCFRTGRLEQAVQRFESALARTSDPARRSEIRARISHVHFTNLDTTEAIGEVKRALAEAGKPFPKTLFFQVASMLGYWLVGQTLSSLGIFFGRARGKRREKHETLARLYELGANIAYFHMDDFLVIQMVTRSLYHTHLLGPSAVLMKCLGTYAVAMTVIGFKGLGRRYVESALKVSRSLGDRLTPGYANMYLAATTDILGDAPGACEVARLNIERNGRWMEAGLYTLEAAELTWNLLLRGYARESLFWAEKGIAKLENASAKGLDKQGQPFHLYAAAALSMLGRPLEGVEHLRKEGIDDYRALETLYRERAHKQKVRVTDILACLVAFHLEQQELGAPLDDAIGYYLKFGHHPGRTEFFMRHFYVFQAYARLAQCSDPKAGDSPDRFDELRAALKQLKMASMAPIFECHRLAIEGALQRLQGRHEDALRTLHQADEVARKADSPWAGYEISRQRALLLLSQGRSAIAVREAGIAHQLAIQNGWAARARMLRLAFPMLDTLAGATGSTSHSVRIAPASPQALKFKRHLDSLLQLSLASAMVVDPDEQAKVALDESVKLLGAERAFLFLREEGDGELVMKAARSGEGLDLHELRGYSTTVVGQVAESRQAVVVTGTEKGIVSESESMVVHNLRSIIAAPLMVRERMLGVVYLDSRIAKGIFNQEDVEILQALAHHIAVALERAQAAKLEVEAARLQKDLEAKRTIQTILDNLDQGFMSFDESGVIRAPVSKASRSFFGMDPCDQALGDLLQLDPAQAEGARQWIEAIFTAGIPFESLKSFGPRAFQKIDERYIELDYRPILAEGANERLERVIVVATDKTQERKFEAKAKAEAAMVKMILGIMRNRQGFAQFLRDTGELIRRYEAELSNSPERVDLNELMRILHTIKGGSALYHVHDLKELAHQLESRVVALQDGGKERLRQELPTFRQTAARMRGTLDAFLRKNRQIIGRIDDGAERERSIPVSRIYRFADRMRESLGSDAPVVRDFYEECVLEPIHESFAKFESVVQQVAEQVGKEVAFELQDDSVRVHVEPYLPLIESLVHAFRNAVDHGIEAPEVRETGGKSRIGRIRVAFDAIEGGSSLRIRVSDDGQGISSASVASVALRKGLKTESELSRLSPVELLQLVFEPGFSTRGVVSELSGRGVGLDAVLAEARKLGGRAWLESVVREGSSLVVDAPLVRSRT